MQVSTVTYSLLPVKGPNEVKGAGLTGQCYKQDLPVSGDRVKFDFDSSLPGKLTSGYWETIINSKEDGASTVLANTPYEVESGSLRAIISYDRYSAGIE